jgi:prolyl-tRNA synthetase
MSRLFVETLRETPSDAEVVSHQPLVRAGYIKKLTNGIYNFLPLMWRVLTKIEKITREEMNRAGAQEILMPTLQPEELWQESGRWEIYGKELMRLQDRHGRFLALGPTHEEVVTAIARECIRSYKQLPLNLYQIQTKFRDEIRPRFGLLRGREFIMKDAYSFDANEEGLDKSYQAMTDAYTRIFKRCGLETRMVRSDSGAIGGSVSHEFMVLVDTESGENDILYCDKCDYAANTNHAESIMHPAKTEWDTTESIVIDTPNTKTIEELANFLNIPQSIICKTLVYIADSKSVLALIRGDQNVEETKLKNAIGANEIRIATAEEIEELMAKNNFKAESGFIGPNGIKNVKIVADPSVKELKNFVIGINKNDVHRIGANWGTEIQIPEIFADIRLAKAGELCPVCKDILKITKGIEVGNIFKLGTKYSKAMSSTFMDEDGKDKPFIMGCYGIGITRTAAAAIEKYHDVYGIIWPTSIAPYHVVIVPVNVKDELQMNVAEELYNNLKNEGIEVVIDDRNERAGVKFKDADLIGFPLRITVGKLITEGFVEYKERQQEKAESILKDDVFIKIKEYLKIST